MLGALSAALLAMACGEPAAPPQAAPQSATAPKPAPQQVLSKAAAGELLARYQAQCMDRVLAHYKEVVAPQVGFAPGKGTARVDVLIGADGAIERMTVLQSSGDQALDEAVLQMVRKAGRFDPIPEPLRGDSGRITLSLNLSFDSTAAAKGAR